MSDQRDIDDLHGIGDLPAIDGRSGIDDLPGPRPADGTEDADDTDDTRSTDRVPTTDLWTTVDALWHWLETSRAPDDARDPRDVLLLRMLKLSEEVGEAAQAVIGATGQNPRKGVTHSWQDVESELCDVVITALVALRTLTPDTREVFMGHLARVATRSVTPSHGSAPGKPACAGE
jgi:NTP pyrophosphatase (non-canonical NTP hydrolase)